MRYLFVRQTQWFVILIVTTLAAGAVAAEWFFKEYKSGILWPEPPVIDPGSSDDAPEDAIVLFDGKDLSAWHNGDAWEIRPEGYAITKGGDIKTKQSFGDCQLHVEFATPAVVAGSGQGRGNSGIFFMDRYEIQLLDSYNNETYYDGQCASIYKQHPPIVNACRKPGQWQSYDIIFTAPRFDDAGNVVTPGYMTVLHNGVLVQNHAELYGSTYWHRPPAYELHAAKLPIRIQYHRDRVRFRNIWIRENVQNLVDQHPEQKPIRAPKPDLAEKQR